MITLKKKKKINDKLLAKIKTLLEKEKIQGEFWVLEDQEIKNRYNIIIRAKNIKTTEKRIKKETELEKKLKSAIPSENFLVIINPA